MRVEWPIYIMLRLVSGAEGKSRLMSGLRDVSCSVSGRGSAITPVEWPCEVIYIPAEWRCRGRE